MRIGDRTLTRDQWDLLRRIYADLGRGNAPAGEAEALGVPPAQDLRGSGETRPDL